MSNKLKAADLRIGNILNYNTAEGDVLPMRITIGDLSWISENEVGFNLVHSPILITEDELLKLSFKEEYRSVFDIRYTHKKRPEFGYDWNRSFGWRLRHYGNHFDCKFVHKMQNVFYVLTNQELTTND